MLLDLAMAWRNIWRNPRRTVLTVAAIAFACILLIFMLAWQFGSYEVMINSAVRISTGHLQVQAKGYQDKQTLRLVVDHPEAVGRALDKIPQVAAYTYRAATFSLASSKKRTYGVLVVGVDPQREIKVSTLKTTIRKGSFFSPSDRATALIGTGLAKNLNAGPGDKITILGQGKDGSIAASVVTVKGVYKSGQTEFDRASIQVPLKFFQDLYGMDGSVNQVVILATGLEEVGIIKKRLEKDLAAIPNRKPLVVLDWRQLMPGLLQSIQMDLFSGLIFYAILIVVVAFSILNTFLMSVLERTREFGVLMAMGVTPRRLIRLVMMESTALTAIGVVSGIVAGCLITWYFQVNGIDLSGSAGAAELMAQYGIPGRMHPLLTPLSVAIGPALVLFFTFFAALLPALKVRKLKPVEALSQA